MPSTQQRIAATIFFSQSLFSAAFIVITNLLSIIAADLSGAEALAGLPQALTTLTQAAFAFPLGLILGRYGRRPGLSLAYSMGVAGSLIGVAAVRGESFPLLLMATMGLGMARAGAEQSRFAAAEVFPQQDRSKIIGWIVFAGTFGSISGSALVAPSALWAESWNLPPEAGVWMAAAALFGGSLLTTYLLLRPDPRELGQALPLEDKQTAEVPLHTRPMREVFQQSPAQLALAAMLIGQVVMVGIMVMTPLQMKHHAHGKEAISLVIAAHTLGMFGLSPITGRLIARFGQVNIITAGAVILILSAVLAPLSTQMAPLIAALFLLGLGWNFCFIAGSSLLTTCVNAEERSRAQGLNDTFIALASAAGSLSSGLIFDLGGYLLVSLLGLLLVLVLTGVIGRLAPQTALPKAV
jgi:MFS family permease